MSSDDVVSERKFTTSTGKTANHIQSKPKGIFHMSNRVTVFIVLDQFFGDRSEAENFARHWTETHSETVSIWRAKVSAKAFKQIKNRTARRPAFVA